MPAEISGGWPEKIMGGPQCGAEKNGGRPLPESMQLLHLRVYITTAQKVANSSSCFYETWCTNQLGPKLLPFTLLVLLSIHT